MTTILHDKWDRRFLELAAHVAQWSKDPSTKCGAVIVRPDKTICSVGYNGFPRNMKDDQELYDHRDIKYDRIIHAEMNAILNANEVVKGFTLYTHPGPSCLRCAAHVIQAGIVRVVSPHVIETKGGMMLNSKPMFDEAGVEVTLV